MRLVPLPRIRREDASGFSDFHRFSCLNRLREDGVDDPNNVGFTLAAFSVVAYALQRRLKLGHAGAEPLDAVLCITQLHLQLRNAFRLG